MIKWLIDYKVSTQLLCYGVYEQSSHDYMVKEIFSRLMGELKQGNLKVDCISIYMDTKLTQGVGRALDLEEAIAMHSLIYDMSSYNKFTLAYYNALANPQLVSENAWTHAQVIQEFTRGLCTVVGKENVAVLSEM